MDFGFRISGRRMKRCKSSTDCSDAGLFSTLPCSSSSPPLSSVNNNKLKLLSLAEKTTSSPSRNIPSPGGRSHSAVSLLSLGSTRIYNSRTRMGLRSKEKRGSVGVDHPSIPDKVSHALRLFRPGALVQSASGSAPFRIKNRVNSAFIDADDVVFIAGAKSEAANRPSAHLFRHTSNNAEHAHYVQKRREMAAIRHTPSQGNLWSGNETRQNSLALNSLDQIRSLYKSVPNVNLQCADLDDGLCQSYSEKKRRSRQRQKSGDHFGYEHDQNELASKASLSGFNTTSSTAGPSTTSKSPTDSGYRSAPRDASADPYSQGFCTPKTIVQVNGNIGNDREHISAKKSDKSLQPVAYFSAKTPLRKISMMPSSAFPIDSTQVISVLKEGKCKNLTHFLSLSLVPRLVDLLNNLLIQICERMAHLAMFWPMFAMEDVVAAIKIIYPPDVYTQCLRFVGQTCSGLSALDELSISLSKRVGLRLSVGNVFRYMVDKLPKKMIAEQVPYAVTACLEYSVEEFVRRLVDNDEHSEEIVVSQSCAKHYEAVSKMPSTTTGKRVKFDLAAKLLLSHYVRNGSKQSVSIERWIQLATAFCQHRCRKGDLKIEQCDIVQTAKIVLDVDCAPPLPPFFEELSNISQCLVSLDEESIPVLVSLCTAEDLKIVWSGNLEDFNGWHPILWAAACDCSSETMNVLLKKYAVVPSDRLLETALKISIERGNNRLVEFFLNCKANPFTFSKLAKSNDVGSLCALTFAAIRGNNDSIDLMLKRDSASESADCESRNSNGKPTAEMNSVCYTDVEMEGIRQAAYFAAQTCQPTIALRLSTQCGLNWQANTWLSAVFHASRQKENGPLVSLLENLGDPAVFLEQIVANGRADDFLSVLMPIIVEKETRNDREKLASVAAATVIKVLWKCCTPCLEQSSKISSVSDARMDATLCSTHRPTIDISFVNNEHLSDVRFQIGDETIFGHRIVLFNASGKFKKLLQSPLGVIHITDVSSEIFLAMMKFLYTGQLPSMMSIHEASCLVTVADLYGLPAMRKQAFFVLGTGISTSNYDEVYKFAIEQGDPQLLRQCEDFVLDNFDTFCANHLLLTMQNFATYDVASALSSRFASVFDNFARNGRSKDLTF